MIRKGYFEITIAVAFALAGILFGFWVATVGPGFESPSSTALIKSFMRHGPNPAWLRACGTDSKTREQVQSLIARAGRGDASFYQGVQQKVAEAFRELRQVEMSGRKIGPYEIRTLLGAGGMDI